MSTDADRLEERLSAAMNSLAATHSPIARQIEPDGNVHHRRSRWMLGAAAAVVLAAGIAALVAVNTRDVEQTPPALTIAEVPPTSEESVVSLPSVETPNLRFSDPLGDDIVPVLDPAPSESVTGFRPEGNRQGWVRGIEAVTQFAVMDGEDVIGAISVTDSLAPWATFSDDKEITLVGGIEAVVIPHVGGGIFLRRGEFVRRVSDPGLTLEVEVLSTDIELLATLVGDEPIDAFTSTPRFVRLAIEGVRYTNVQYDHGDSEGTSLTLTRLTQSPAPSEVTTSGAYINLVRTQHGSTQVVAVEQVSPLDLLTIIAPTADDLDTARRSIDFAREVESGIEFGAGNRLTDIVEARGEPSWGRWELNISSTDDSCWDFFATMWSDPNSGFGDGECSGEDEPRRQVYCHNFGNGIVAGAVIDHDSPIQVESTIDGATVLNEPDGRNTSFKIEAFPGVSNSADFATIIVDGEAFALADICPR